MRGCGFILIMLAWAVAAVYGMFMFLTTVALLETWMSVIVMALLTIVTWLAGDD